METVISCHLEQVNGVGIGRGICSYEPQRTEKAETCQLIRNQSIVPRARSFHDYCARSTFER